jgi:hypothetical protein
VRTDKVPGIRMLERAVRPTPPFIVSVASKGLNHWTSPLFAIHARCQEVLHLKDLEVNIIRKETGLAQLPPYPPNICKNMEIKGLQNLHSVSD